MSTTRSTPMLGGWTHEPAAAVGKVSAASINGCIVTINRRRTAAAETEAKLPDMEQSEAELPDMELDASYSAYIGLEAASINGGTASMFGSTASINGRMTEPSSGVKSMCCCSKWRLGRVLSPAAIPAVFSSPRWLLDVDFGQFSKALMAVATKNLNLMVDSPQS
eukprot:3035150-Rhodomonas_salina.4